MSGQTNALATRGVICKGGDRTFIRRCILPFNLKLEKESFPLNLKLNVDKQLNLSIQETKLNIKKVPSLKLNKRLPTSFKLNLKKCED